MTEFALRSKGGEYISWPQLQACMGDFPHLNVVKKFGGSTSLSTTYTPVAVGSIYRTPTTATALELVSSSTEDSAAGIGARTVQVTGLSSDWTEINEEVSPNGTSAVALSNSFTRVYRASVTESGSYASSTMGSHQGRLTIREASTGPIWAEINNTILARGQSQIGSYTVPLGKTGYVYLHHISVDSNKTADFIFVQRPNANTVSAPYSGQRTVAEHVGVSGVIPLTDSNAPEGPFVGPCDIGFMGKASASAEAQAQFKIILVDN